MAAVLLMTRSGRDCFGRWRCQSLYSDIRIVLPRTLTTRNRLFTGWRTSSKRLLVWTYMLPTTKNIVATSAGDGLSDLLRALQNIVSRGGIQSPNIPNSSIKVQWYVLSSTPLNNVRQNTQVAMKKLTYTRQQAFSLKQETILTIVGARTIFSLL